MFVDSVKLTITSGKGGAGCVSFRREKFVIQGGPDGGDGGKGGDIYFYTDGNTDTLSKFKGKKALKADNGKQGMGRKMHGKSGEDLVITVPPGTQIIDENSGEVLLDLLEKDVKTKFLEGGKGGLGNFHFRSSTNQKPTYAQPGLEGKTLLVKMELKLIADVGLVGYPNVGKSTLVSSISNAKPEIANYEFTTLIPNLGVINVGDLNSFVMADIPGIIDGASEGKGLGIEFLRHIERTKILLFMIDLTNYRDIINQYENLKKEVKKFSEELYNRPFSIALTKLDALDEESANKEIDRFLKSLKLKPAKNSDFKIESSYSSYIQKSEYDKNKPYFVLPISSSSNINLEALKFMLNAQRAI